jgi:biotin carboxyl carrier protein
MSETTYQVTQGEHVFRVHLRRVGDQLFARVDDGPEIPASLDNVRGTLYSLSLAQARLEVLCAVADDSVQLTINGVRFDAEVVDEARARLASMVGARATSHARRELRAPMPGLLVNVMVKPGDSVEPNQPLAVLRAMKMENELSVPRGGTIVAVSAEAGQTVEQNQVILIVE